MLLPLLLIGCAESSIVRTDPKLKALNPGDQVKIIGGTTGEARTSFWGWGFFSIPVQAAPDEVPYKDMSADGMQALLVQAEKQAETKIQADALVNESATVDSEHVTWLEWAYVARVKAIGVKLVSN